MARSLGMTVPKLMWELRICELAGVARPMGLYADPEQLRAYLGAPGDKAARRGR